MLGQFKDDRLGRHTYSPQRHGCRTLLAYCIMRGGQDAIRGQREQAHGLGSECLNMPPARSARFWPCPASLDRSWSARQPRPMAVCRGKPSCCLAGPAIGSATYRQAMCWRRRQTYAGRRHRRPHRIGAGSSAYPAGAPSLGPHGLVGEGPGNRPKANNRARWHPGIRRIRGTARHRSLAHRWPRMACTSSSTCSIEG